MDLILNRSSPSQSPAGLPGWRLLAGRLMNYHQPPPTVSLVSFPEPMHVHARGSGYTSPNPNSEYVLNGNIGLNRCKIVGSASIDHTTEH